MPITNPIEDKMTEEVSVFSDSKTLVNRKQVDDNYIQFVSKETYESYPREELNRYNNKGLFYYDNNDKKIKSIYYSESSILPRVLSFSNNIDTLRLSKQDVQKQNSSKITFKLNATTIAGDFNDWLINVPYRKSYSVNQNDIEIRIFDVPVGNISRIKSIAEFYNVSVVEDKKTEENDRIDK